MSQKHGYNKNIVILTRPVGYIKTPSPLRWLSLITYRKFPQFVRAIINRHKMYNSELDYVANQEALGTTIVIRPSKQLKVKKMERDLEKVQAMYNLGRSDALAVIEKIKAFISGS